jgi:DNA-directed RNA polymerase specialized sigma24 family protein
MQDLKGGKPYRVREPAAVAEVLRNFFGSDPDRIEAEYGKLRARMIHYFAARRCPYPDELGDEVIARALRQIKVGADIPDLTRYCYGIAANLRSEKRKKKEEVEIVGDPAAPGASAPGRPSFEEQVLLLGECLAMVSAKDRDMLREYYWDDRKELAQRLQLTPNALRLRVFHAVEQIRQKIRGRSPGDGNLKRDSV